MQRNFRQEIITTSKRKKERIYSSIIRDSYTSTTYQTTQHQPTLHTFPQSQCVSQNRTTLSRAIPGRDLTQLTVHLEDEDIIPRQRRPA